MIWLDSMELGTLESPGLHPNGGWLKVAAQIPESELSVL
jgi:hypothetical protein